MLSVVTFKWTPAPHYRSTFTSEVVNVLQRMVARHYQAPHRFVCITDDAAGLDPAVEAVPLWTDYAEIPSPNGGHNPSCYRRLKMFSREIAEIVGPRFVCLDLDTVIVNDVRPLWDRPEDFVVWGETNPRSYYNGSMWLLRTGTRTKVWEDFDPRTSPQQAFAAGKFGSDQGWLSHCLGKGEATWTREDGVYSYNVHLRRPPVPLPPSARIVMFHGGTDPWSPEAQRLSWVREHWR